MKYKIVVLDLDGTLTNSNKELSERNRMALIRLQQQGVTVVLASGRPTYGIVPLAEALELAKYGGYILSYNGGIILECATNRIIHSSLLPQECLPLLYSESVEGGTVILFHDNESIVTECATDKYVEFEANLNRMSIREVDSFLGAISEPIAKCLAVGEPEKVLCLESRLKEVFDGVLNIYRSEPFFLEIVPLNIDKAYSLSLLLTHLGDSRESMIAFGDGFNDLTMIEYAGFGVAMSNAQDIVKASARAVTLSNDEDGVADYIEKFLLSPTC